MKIFAILFVTLFLVSCGAANNTPSVDVNTVDSGDTVDEVSNDEDNTVWDMENSEAELEAQRERSAEFDFVWLSEEEAMELASKNNIPFRVIMRDGEMLPATMDYRPGRINAEVEDAIIVDFSIE